MKSNIVIAPFLISVTFAQPHRHQHQNLHAKRDTIWVTDIEWVTTTVDVTTTVWIDPNSTPPPASTTQPPPAEFHETIASSNPTVPVETVNIGPSSSPSSTTITTAAPSPYVAPPINIDPAPSPSTTPLDTPSPTSPVLVVATPAASPSATPSPQAGAPSSGYSGECSASSPCTGEFTFYDTSMAVYGSCGWSNDGLSEAVVALPAGFMGAQSNGNPLCGKTITLQVGAITITAKAVDKCPGCSDRSVDLSRKAFGLLADFSVGRVQGKWFVN